MKFTYSSGSRPLEGYTIKRGIGHGGFGEVYYAVSDGGKEVALKLVQRNLDVELRGVAQCMNLKHPNLVTLYDLRTNDGGEHFVVMEYVSGASLAELLEEHPSGFTLDDVNRWLKGICAGIGYLHDKGIVHRDLKPGNVFVEDGVVKVGDYGLSKFITASRRSGQTESVGTVHYMAPEISRGKYDREIDIYATGIILYEMITGHVPFDGESVGEILMKHLTAQPDVSKLPAPYDQIVTKALEKDPAARFRTMEELGGSLNGRLIEPVPPSQLKDTVAYAPAPGDVPVPPSGPVSGSAIHATADRHVPPISVPFWISNVYEGFAQAHGLVRFDGTVLTLQFEVKDNLVGLVKSGLRDARIALSDVTSLSLRSNWFSTHLVLQCSNLACLGNVPTSGPGRVTLNISREDRETARRLVAAVASALAPSQGVERAACAPPAASPETAAACQTGDWFSRMRAKAIAWYERPWGAKDYFLAVLCMIVMATAGTAVMGSVIAVLPAAVVVLGIVLIVMKITKKNPFGTAGAGPRVPPVVLSPANVFPQASPSPPVVVSPAGAPGATPMPAPVAVALHVSRHSRPVAPREVPPKPARTRLVEASSAMLLTTVLAVIAAVLAAGLMHLDKIQECALLAAATLAGCWGVLIPAKIWEGRQGDAMLRRLVMAALGLGVGLWCSYLDGVLQVGWLNDPENTPTLFESLAWMPKLLVDASYFGLVFLIPRWWLLADSRRPLKFNPWLVIMPCLWAWLIALLWSTKPPADNPQFWGVVVTGMVALLVQLATPWDDPATRRRTA